MEKTNEASYWHNGKEEPTKDGAMCIVLVGVYEDGNDAYEFLMWSEKHKAFEWREKINGKTAYFPSDNFEKWAYKTDAFDYNREDTLAVKIKRK